MHAYDKVDGIKSLKKALAGVIPACYESKKILMNDQQVLWRESFIDLFPPFSFYPISRFSNTLTL